MDHLDEVTKKPRPRIYKLEDTGYDPVVHIDSPEEENIKIAQAIAKSNEWDEKIPTGIFYKNEIIAPYDERIGDRIPNYLENPPAYQEIASNGRPLTDIKKILDRLQV